MSELAPYIEHTLLRSDTTKEQVEVLCKETLEHNFYGVCVPPYFVKQAANYFKEHESDKKVVTVIGFPLGYLSVSAKVEEIKKAIQDGADELDVVINLSAYLSGDIAVVKNDIQSVVTSCHLQGKMAKIIIETGALTEEQAKDICAICTAAEANYVKTSTGFHERGVSVEAVKLLRNVLPSEVKVKASGGIRDAAFAQALLDAGAERLGTSSGLQLIGQS